MNIERLALRRRLIAFLHDTCPALVEAMKRARHLYPGDDSTKNAHHLEDTVWTHMLLVLQAALEREDFGLTDILTALVHDFGKPATQVVRPRKSGPGRRHSFSGHGPAGVQTAVDFLDALVRAGVVDIPDEDVARIAFATSLHLQFYDLEDPADALHFCNDDRTYLEGLTRLLHCDLQGSVGDTEGASFGKNLQLLDGIEHLFRGMDEVGHKTAPCAGHWPSQGPGTIHLVCGNVPRARASFAAHLVAGHAADRAADHATDRARKLLLVRCSPWSEDREPSQVEAAWDTTCSIAAGADVLDLPMPLVLRVLKETPRRLKQDRHVQEVRTRLEEGLAHGIVVEGALCTRKERKSLAGFLKTILPEGVLACTYVLSREHDFLDPKTEFSAALGIVGPTREQVLPCLLHEPNLAAARVVHVRMSKADGQG